MKKTALVSLTVIGLSSSLHILDAKSSHAATVFSSLAAFEAALSSPSTVIDDYNEFTSFTSITTPLDRGVYSLTDQQISEMSVGFIGGTGFQNVDGTGHMVISSTSGAGITFSFDDPFSAVGFDYTVGSGSGDVQVTAEGFSDTITTNSASQFFGVIFDSPVSSFTLSNVSSPQIGVDNLRTGVPATSTPEPTTILGLLAVGSLGALSRKRKG